MYLSRLENTSYQPIQFASTGTLANYLTCLTDAVICNQAFMIYLNYVLIFTNLIASILIVIYIYKIKIDIDHNMQLLVENKIKESTTTIVNDINSKITSTYSKQKNEFEQFLSNIF